VELLENQNLDSNDLVLSIIIVLGFLVFLIKKIDPNQFYFLKNPFKIKLYYQRYFIDKSFKIFDKFYLLIYSYILVSISLFLSFFGKYFLDIPITIYNFLKVFSLLTIFLFLRSLAYIIILQIIKNRDILQRYWFHFLIFNIQSIFFLIIITTTLELDGFLTLKSFKYILIAFISLSVYFYLYTFVKTLKDSTKNFFYLFYYICAAKILPWVLLANYCL
tara:strand:+ start:1044 stop:1700 length:657 start_codon:yes stop_codon:yes gene_type:complete